MAKYIRESLNESTSGGRNAVWKERIEAPRGSEILRYLRDLEMICDVELTIKHTQKGLFDITIWFEVKGLYENVKKYRDTLLNTIKKYNEEE